MNNTAESIYSQPIDVAHIQKVSNLLFVPGDVVELRSVRTSQGTISGYFNDFERLASEAARLSGSVPGVM